MIDIKKLSKLPFKESRKDYLTRKFGDMWNIAKFDHPWHDGEPSESPWKRAEWILKKNIGKSFDDAFSYYCTFVEKHEQRYFLREFQPRYWHTPDYIIDNQKRIQVNPDRYKRKKKPIVFRSFDYKEGYYHIPTKTMRESVHWTEMNDNYIRVIIQGFERTFKNKKDPEYKKLMAEKAKAEKRNYKLLKEIKAEKADTFLSKHNHENKIIKQTASKEKEQSSSS